MVVLGDEKAAHELGAVPLGTSQVNAGVRQTITEQVKVSAVPAVRIIAIGFNALERSVHQVVLVVVSAISPNFGLGQGSGQVDALHLGEPGRVTSAGRARALVLVAAQAEKVAVSCGQVHHTVGLDFPGPNFAVVEVMTVVGFAGQKHADHGKVLVRQVLGRGHGPQVAVRVSEGGGIAATLSELNFVDRRVGCGVDRDVRSQGDGRGLVCLARQRRELAAVRAQKTEEQAQHEPNIFVHW